MATVFTELPGDLLGYYQHSSGRMFVDRRMSAVRQRSTEVHEEVHRVFGHQPLDSQPKHVVREIATERVSAMIMIAFPSLLRAMTRFPDSLDKVAHELYVDVDTLLARILGLTPLEQSILEACGRHCIGFGSEQAERGCPVSPLTGARR